MGWEGQYLAVGRRDIPCAQGVGTPATLHIDCVAEVLKDFQDFVWHNWSSETGNVGGEEMQSIRKNPGSCTRCPGGGRVAEAPRKVLCLVLYYERTH